jgi:hypothetical protein
MVGGEKGQKRSEGSRAVIDEKKNDGSGSLGKRAWAIIGT